MQQQVFQMTNPRKPKLLGVLLSGALLLLLGACATPPLQVGQGDISEEGLQRLGGTAFDEVWARPGVDLRRFQVLAMDQANIYYRDVEGGGGEPSLVRDRQRAFVISERDRNRIESFFQQRFSEALQLSPNFQYSSEVVPGALLMRASLVDYVSLAPSEGELSGRAQVWVRYVAEATLIVELWDTARDELLVRATDQQQIEPAGWRLTRGDSVTRFAAIDRQLQRWASDVRLLVDQFYLLGGTETLGTPANRQ